MSTIVFRDAKLLVNGAELTAALHELAIDYSSEMLDETTFGDDTRVNKGGLRAGKMSGKGFHDGAVGTEPVLFRGLGDGSAVTVNPAYVSGAQVEDTLLLLFPDGVTEGSTTTGMGYAMKGVLSDFNIGGAVGTLLDINFSAESRGIEG